MYLKFKWLLWIHSTISFVSTNLVILNILGIQFCHEIMFLCTVKETYCVFPWKIQVLNVDPAEEAALQSLELLHCGKLSLTDWHTSAKNFLFGLSFSFIIQHCIKDYWSFDFVKKSLKGKKNAISLIVMIKYFKVEGGSNCYNGLSSTNQMKIFISFLESFFVSWANRLPA